MTALVAGAAAAGGIADPAPTPVVSAPPAAAPASDWTGFYAGAQLGFGKADTQFALGGPVSYVLESDNRFAGLHAGYMRDLGAIVVGGRIGYEVVKVEFDGVEAFDDDPSLLSLAGTVGYDAGQFLPYGVLGLTRFDLPELETEENGVLFGLGVKYMMTPQIMVGAELNRTVYNDYLEGVGGQGGPGADGQLTSEALRLSASYRF